MITMIVRKITRLIIAIKIILIILIIIIIIIIKTIKFTKVIVTTSPNLGFMGTMYASCLLMA